MIPLADEAAKLRVGLQLGLVSAAQVVSWADSNIVAMEEPPVEIIDLAMMRDSHPQDLIGKLGDVDRGQSDTEVLPRVLGEYAGRLREDPSLGRTVARGLWEIYVASGYDVPSELSPISSFDDDYALALDGVYGSEEQVFLELVTFMERFKGAP